jgi:proline iminopeptidase
MKWSLLTAVLFFTNYCFSQAFPNSETDGTYYTVNGSKLWTVSFGSGEPMILIAGGPGGAHVGMRVFDSLSKNCRLIYFDAFGRGKSDTAKNVKEYTLARDIEDVEELRKAMKLDKINVLGHSYGTVVAQGYAIKYPQHVSHLILSSPLHSNVMWQENCDNCNRQIRISYPEVWDSLVLIRKQGFRSSDSLHRAVYGRVPSWFLYGYNPETLINFPRVPYPNKRNMNLYYQMVGKDGDFKVTSDLGTFDYRPKLKDLKMPILVIAGRYDRVAVPWMTIQYKQYCPQARFELFEKSGHISIIEEPTKTITLIRECLAK